MTLQICTSKQYISCMWFVNRYQESHLYCQCQNLKENYFKDEQYLLLAIYKCEEERKKINESTVPIDGAFFNSSSMELNIVTCCFRSPVRILLGTFPQAVQDPLSDATGFTELDC